MRIFTSVLVNNFLFCKDLFIFRCCLEVLIIFSLFGKSFWASDHSSLWRSLLAYLQRRGMPRGLTTPLANKYPRR